jgi:AraC-like DNA-binding protein
MSWINAPQVHHLLDALQARGIDRSRICREVGLDGGNLLVSGVRISSDTYLAIWAAAEALSLDSLIGLHAAEMPRVRGFLGLVGRAQPSAREMLARFARFAPVISDELRLELHPQAGRTCVRVEMEHSEAPARHGIEYFTALSLFALRDASGGRFRAMELRFPHAPGGPIQEYERVLGCSVRFRRPHIEWVIAEDMLDTPLKEWNPEWAPLIEHIAEAQLAAAVTSALSARAAQVLRGALARGEHPSAEEVAHRLGVSTRTLQRRLAEEGRSLRDLRDEALREHAVDRLRDRSATLSQVADELGFAETSAFAKAFKRWFGESPTRWRRRDANGGDRGGHAGGK